MGNLAYLGSYIGSYIGILIYSIFSDIINSYQKYNKTGIIECSIFINPKNNSNTERQYGKVRTSIN